MKKTLLMAAAALAAGLITSQAQPVYSQNIVGYVNSVFQPSSYSLVGTPLQGTNNSAELILGGALQGGESVLLWNGGGFDTYTYLAPGLWLTPGGPGAAPSIPAGTAFFYYNSGGNYETNTFAGTVILTNSVNMPASSYQMTASIAPISSSVDNTNINLPVAGGESVLLYNGSGYDTYTYLAPGLWLGPSGPGSAPVVGVGQAFFYYNSQGSSEAWNQNVVVP